MRPPRLRVLVAEPSAPIGAVLRKFLEGEAQATVVTSSEEALVHLKQRVPDVLISATHGGVDGEALVAKARAISKDVGVVLVYPPDEERAVARGGEFGADAALVGPLKRSAVLGALATARRVRQLERQVRELSRKVAEGQAPKEPKTRLGLNAADDSFFRKYILLEVKRSKRYLYPVSLLLVSLDHLDEAIKAEAEPELKRAQVVASVIHEVSAMLRDVDVVMPFTGERLVVFLPYTDLKGARLVAGRLVGKLSGLTGYAGTGSVGVSCYEPKAPHTLSVSFAGLVKEALKHLKTAQSAGGNRFEAIAEGEPPKRERISLG